MSVRLLPPNPLEILPIPGITIGITQAGVKKAGKDDLTVFCLEDGVGVGGVFTKNRFKAAPVQICEELLRPSDQAISSKKQIRALIINTGNANAGTGLSGIEHARLICQKLALLLELQPEQILPFSTGVIMEPLPYTKIIDALPSALKNLKSNAWAHAAHSIMTTDTVAKAFSTTLKLSGVPISITGIAKGAGMIHPNMATMLGYLATDASIDPKLLNTLALEIANASFNRITVDGDTSTNDSFILMATGKALNPQIKDLESIDGQALKGALMHVAVQLAQAIVRDAEGATKFMTLNIHGGRTLEECKSVALAIAHSPLVKTAFFASDPNLGRILAAVGYAGIEDLEQSLIELYLDDVHVASGGARHPQYREEDGQRVMKKEEIAVTVDLGRGSAKDTFWTCDLSHEYVSINADYRS
jgi:glutamate N-acetyltransferase/amino-acid N-acetyltransferase